jgi:uncharacterized metal-binding protein (TIGR02443 family)
MKRRRFIAGAVCPACGAMDRLVLEPEGSGRRCVACGYRDELPVAASRAPKTRGSGGPGKAEADKETARPVRILDTRRTSFPGSRSPNDTD